MGWIEMNAADWPAAQKRRGEAFTEPEGDRLVQEVRRRKNIIYGIDKRPHTVRKAWEEISKIISKVSGIERSRTQCRKRYNDMKRRGQIPPPRKRGRPPKIKPWEINTPDISNTTSNNEETAVDDVIELSYQAPLEDDPDPEPSRKKQEPVLIVEPKEPEQPPPSIPPPSIPPPSIPPPSILPPSTLPPSILPPSTPPPSNPPPPNNRGTPQPRIRNISAQHEEHPLIELQKGGFTMLQRELSSVQQSIVSLNTRLNQIEVLLRPIGHIADSLARIATAVERLTCPPTNL